MKKWLVSLCLQATCCLCSVWSSTTRIPWILTARRSTLNLSWCARTCSSTSSSRWPCCHWATPTAQQPRPKVTPSPTLIIVISFFSDLTLFFYAYQRLFYSIFRHAGACAHTHSLKPTHTHTLCDHNSLPPADLKPQ